MNAAHFAMSTTLDQIEPAGATGSTAALVITRGTPATLKCGDATLDFPVVPASVATVLDMPSGSNIRVSTNRSQGIPLAAATTAPAAAYMTF